MRDSKLEAKRMQKKKKKGRFFLCVKVLGKMIFPIGKFWSGSFMSFLMKSKGDILPQE